MEYSVNYSTRLKTYSNRQRTIYEEEEDQGIEESSWTMYFEEDHDDDDEVETEEGSFYYDDSSMISDAASPVGIVAKQIGHRNCNRAKRRRIVRRQCQDGEAKQGEASLACGDLEDTASSPSNSPKICNMLNEMENDTRQESTKDITTKEKECAAEARSTIEGVAHEELSMELKKRGLCLVPMSMLSIYLD
ncbi:PREDICTED: uncharacterized protein LOC104816923 [Tarenaya hassleriana]|uniref:uncharacterized protein LOC104816923 n=1 Tax=Tarenaya hassleriana TaxID=28532 RepID=UPI00053CA1A9|nr:PREDICTED: uncharacterized protein LOC104816923 [Tarenaya hassleriana]